MTITGQRVCHLEHHVSHTTAASHSLTLDEEGDDDDEDDDLNGFIVDVSRSMRLVVWVWADRCVACVLA